MKKNLYRGLLIIGLLAIPATALAQPSLTQGFSQFGGAITSLRENIVNALITLFATMAMAVFFFGIIQYLLGVRDGKEEAIRSGNRFMRWGLVALFVMFSVWGIIIYVQRIFGIQGMNTILIPTVQVQQGGTSNTNTTNNNNTNTTNSTGNNNNNSGNTGGTAGQCTGKTAGYPCTAAAGFPGACGYSDDESGSVWGCYATQADQCPAGYTTGANGCVQITGGAQ